MTAQQYVDEVKLRLSRTDIVLELNDPLILSYVNKARREVQRATLDIIPERYGEVYNVNLLQVLYDQGEVINTYSGRDIRVITLALPDDIIDVYTALLYYKMDASSAWAPDVTYKAEARRMTKTEMYNVLMHSWNTPSIYRPVYAVERSVVNGVYGYWMFISGFDVEAGVTLWDIANSIRSEIWYIKALDDLETYNAAGGVDNEPVIPADIEEVVVYYAMLYCLQNIKEIDSVQSVAADLEQLISVISQNYTLTEQRQLQMLPSKEGI